MQNAVEKAGAPVRSSRRAVAAAAQSGVEGDAGLVRDVLERIGTHSIQKLDELLPHRWAATVQT